MKEIIKKVINSELFIIIFNGIGLIVLLDLFYAITNIYNMDELHRVICILSISAIPFFTEPIFNLFKKD